jgi:hypothetical protein
MLLTTCGALSLFLAFLFYTRADHDAGMIKTNRENAVLAAVRVNCRYDLYGKKHSEVIGMLGDPNRIYECGNSSHCMIGLVYHIKYLKLVLHLDCDEVVVGTQLYLRD